MTENTPPITSDFIRTAVADDLRSGRFTRVVTRFPPEPNGYLHIGHAKAIAVDFGIAADFGGVCNLRFDDTNPSKEDHEYIDSIMEDVRWLGFDWENRLYYASDYFEKTFELAEVLIRNGLGFLAESLGLLRFLPRGRKRTLTEDRTRAALSMPERVRQTLEELGPTYIKLCQIISSGEGIFPSELVDEMKKCRDKVPPVPSRAVRTLVEEELRRPIAEVFASFDDTPIAAASIAQVHGATLLDGTPVVVKVQRPGIRRVVHRDLEVMATIAPLLVGRIPIAALANPPALVELFAETICEELDFRLEAENMIDLASVFAQLDQRGYVIPRPHPDLVTRRMMVMERFDGFGFDDVDGMKAAGIDTHEIIRVGMRGFTEGCMVHGLFHGDLHAGNLMVLRDGKLERLVPMVPERLVAVDLGAGKVIVDWHPDD